MKKIKVKICNYDPSDKFSYGVFLMKILQKNYTVELSDNPEYLFFSESSSEHLNYDCIKIFYTGENVHPNFNFCDYAIGFDYINFKDRYFRLPVYQVSQFYKDAEIALTSSSDFTEQSSFTKNDLANKTDFCSFVYSNYLGEGAREEFFNKLSEYKKVNSGGGYLNNIGGRVDNKLAFESKHKFSIAFENSSNSGYTTEKLPNAIVARTIPIYWGNPDIALEFNEKRFINCHNYKTFDEVVQRVKEIDNDDTLYLDMINQPVSLGYDFKRNILDFEKFLSDIIDQEIGDAKRIRINPAKKATLFKNELAAQQAIQKQTERKKLLAKLYKPFKKIKLLEKIKESYFRKKIFK